MNRVDIKWTIALVICLRNHFWTKSDCITGRLVYNKVQNHSHDCEQLITEGNRASHHDITDELFNHYVNSFKLKLLALPVRITSSSMLCVSEFSVKYSVEIHA